MKTSLKYFGIVVFALMTTSGNAAPKYTTVFKGLMNGKQIVVVSVNKTYTEEKLDKIISPLNGNNVTVLVYRDFKNVSMAMPLAVYVDGKTALFNNNPTYLASGTTVSKIIERAFRNGPRIGAICKDGWRSRATGRGACSHHGGVAYWLYSKVRNTNAIIATIYKDHQLVSGDGKNSGRNPSEVFVQIRNRSYD